MNSAKREYLVTASFEYECGSSDFQSVAVIVTSSAAHVAVRTALEYFLNTRNYLGYSKPATGFNEYNGPFSDFNFERLDDVERIESNEI